jgi:hypothetical protein
MGEGSVFVGHPGGKLSTVTTPVRAHRVECPGNGR